MKKSYSVQRKFFVVDVAVVGAFCAALLAWSVWGLAFGSPFPRLLLGLVAAICAYQVWNTFCAIANPETVELGDDTLSFSAFGRTDSFALDEMREFSVRDFAARERMYVRVNGGGLLKGRYWIQTGKMDEGDELYQRLSELEERVSPDSLRVRARRSSTVAKGR